MIRNYSGQDITVLDRDEKQQKVVEIEVNDKMIVLGVPSEGIDALIYRPLGQEKLLGSIVAELVSQVSNRHYIYQSPLKMLDFLSKPDHACSHENSSDTRTKTRPRIDARYDS
ncbi:hypothetical protein, partial [Xenorhabdus sp. Sc-CR9]|uniref:hypothetical protein n=1 Tax=Xenorhabdus sp. Sc-CR9 TaxID=2584468 RepID=UPI001F2ADCBF